MSSEDIRNNADVHSLLVRNYFDTRKLDSEVTGETVTINGVAELRREAESVDESVRNAALVRTLVKAEEEIKRIPGIAYVRWNLDNWTLVGKRWVPALASTSKKGKKEPRAARTAALVDRLIARLAEKERFRLKPPPPKNT